MTLHAGGPDRSPRIPVPIKTAGLAALALAIALVAPAAPAQAADGNPHLLVSPERLEAILERELMVETMGGYRLMQLVDVRSAKAFEDGHIPYAIHLDADAVVDPHSHVPGSLKPQDDLAALLGARGIGKDTEVVLYDDRGGLHAARLFWLLEYFGHRKVSILDGGIDNWTRSGRALATAEDTGVSVDGSVAPTRKDFAVTLTPRRAASADWILQHRDDPETLVIDARPARSYGKGHIPWAINLPWTQNVAVDGRMKPLGALRAHFVAHGITVDKRIVVHGESGKAAAQTYFALRLLGYPWVRLYDRSWAEWGTADDLPKATDGSG